jgi:hypothetical protein
MITNLADIEVLPDESIYVSGDVTKNDVYELEFEVGTERLTALRIEALTDERLPGDGPGRQSIDVPNASAEGDFFLSELTAEVIDGADAKTSRRAPFASATASYVTPGMSPESAFDGRADTGWRVMGRQSEPHAAVFLFGEPLTVPAGGRLRLRLQHESFYPAGLGRFRISVARAGAAEHPLALYPEGIAELLRMPDAALSPTDRRELLHFFLLQTPELEERHEEVAALRRQLPRPVNALILKERTKRPRVTRRHHRGEYLSPRGPVSPGSLDVLPPLPSDQAANRLAFARWLVDGRNPLVARVMVNRQWQAFFGRGIVPTLEDFGLQGYFPSHPDLLDYLASELVSQGWSMKRLHKLIVMSATYQQDMEVTPELLAKDPENKLLARAPRFRVEAELVRDATLTASGLLCREVGGPSVFPDQPAGITESAYGPLEWKMSPGKDRYRRGLYTFNKRTAPFAMFGLFDAPSGEACAPRRSTSNTPLQALAMLNETTMMAAARMLATTSLAECREERSIAERMIRRCVTRVPDEQELDAVVAFYHAAKRRLESGDLEAAKIIRAGDESVAVPQESADDVAAWMLTARAVLNLDEVITRQ